MLKRKLPLIEVECIKSMTDSYLKQEVYTQGSLYLATEYNKDYLVAPSNASGFDFRIGGDGDSLSWENDPLFHEHFKVVKVI